MAFKPAHSAASAVSPLHSSLAAKVAKAELLVKWGRDSDGVWRVTNRLDQKDAK